MGLVWMGWGSVHINYFLFTTSVWIYIFELLPQLTHFSASPYSSLPSSQFFLCHYLHCHHNQQYLSSPSPTPRLSHPKITNPWQYNPLWNKLRRHCLRPSHPPKTLKSPSGAWFAIITSKKIISFFLQGRCLCVRKMRKKIRRTNGWHQSSETVLHQGPKLVIVEARWGGQISSPCSICIVQIWTIIGYHKQQLRWGFGHYFFLTVMFYSSSRDNTEKWDHFIIQFLQSPHYF